MQAIGDMAKAVLEPAENAVADAFLDLAHQKVAERAIHRRARLAVVGEQERQIDEAQFRHAVGQITRRLIAERDCTTFDQRQNVLGLVALIHDVPDVVDGDAIAELRLEPVADEFQRPGKTGGRRSVTAHADRDWIAHLFTFSNTLRLRPGVLYTGVAGAVLGSPHQEERQ